MIVPQEFAINPGNLIASINIGPFSTVKFEVDVRDSTGQLISDTADLVFDGNTYELWGSNQGQRRLDRENGNPTPVELGRTQRPSNPPNIFDADLVFTNGSPTQNAFIVYTIDGPATLVNIYAINSNFVGTLNMNAMVQYSGTISTPQLP